MYRNEVRRVAQAREGALRHPGDSWGVSRKTVSVGAQMPSKRDIGRRNEVRRIFQTIYPNGTAAEVLLFYAWLEENGPDLLPPVDQGDQFQRLKADLEGLWSNRPTVSQKRASRKSTRGRQRLDQLVS
jgi:hypothetical protein